MKTILVVEDEQALRQILSDELTKQGFKVLSGKDGVEGLDLAVKNKPDLILIDIVMPKMDGITMLKEIRKNPTSKKIPVMILTNLSDPEQMATALENQAYDYYIKTDLELADLIQRIKTKLGS